MGINSAKSPFFLIANDLLGFFDDLDKNGVYADRKPCPIVSHPNVELQVPIFLAFL